MMINELRKEAEFILRDLQPKTRDAYIGTRIGEQFDRASVLEDLIERGFITEKDGFLISGPDKKNFGLIIGDKVRVKGLTQEMVIVGILEDDPKGGTAICQWEEGRDSKKTKRKDHALSSLERV